MEVPNTARYDHGAGCIGGERDNKRQEGGVLGETQKIEAHQGLMDGRACDATWLVAKLMHFLMFG